MKKEGTSSSESEKSTALEREDEVSGPRGGMASREGHGDLMQVRMCENSYMHEP